VLLVDDDEALGTLVMHALSGQGMSVRWLRDGREAVELLDDPAFRARAMLLDVGLPGLDGLSVLRHMGQSGQLGVTQVVMLTLRSNENEVLKALDLGAFDHVAKPFSLADLGRVTELRRFSRRVRRRVVEELAVSVSGEEGHCVGRVAESLGLSAAARRRCGSVWWWRRLLGAHQLNVHGGGDEILPRLFDDPHYAVRTQVIEWAGDVRREDMASRLASSLHDPSALCQHTAADSILRAGAPLVDTLVRELSSRSGQEQADLMTVLARRPDPRYREVSLAAAGDDLPAVRSAAAALLGGVGGPEAATVLQSLLGDADARVRAAAADGLRRLGDQQAAPALAPLLRDPSFAVREVAGAALAALGPGGILLLHHYLSDGDRYAAGMEE
jgi:CheY-like chemotaxis protein